MEETPIESGTKLRRKINTIFTVQLSVLSLGLLLFLILVAGNSPGASTESGNAYFAGMIAALNAIVFFGAIYIIVFFIASIWGLATVLSLRKNYLQEFTSSARSKVCLLLSSIMMLCSLAMIFLVIYGFYILPHKQGVDAEQAQTDYVNFKKELSAEFTQPQTIQSVNTNYLLQDAAISPGSFSEPEFTLSSGKQIISVDLLQGCGLPKDKISIFTNSLIGKTVNLKFDTWYGATTGLEFDAYVKARNDLTQPIPAHIYSEGNLISCSLI